MKKNNYSISRDLRKNNKSNDYFEIMLSALTLEEIISLKLELSFKSLGVQIYGFNLWNSLPNICREALLKYTISISNTKAEMARYLGLSYSEIMYLLKKYNLIDLTINNRKKINDLNDTTDKINLS